MMLPPTDSRPPVPGTSAAGVTAPGATLALCLLLAINMFNYVDRYVLASVEGHVRSEFFSPDDPNAKRDTGFLSR